MAASGSFLLRVAFFTVRLEAWVNIQHSPVPHELMTNDITNPMNALCIHDEI